MAVSVKSNVMAPTVPPFFTVTELLLDAEYEAEGEKVTAAQLQLAKVDHALCGIKNPSESETVTIMAPWYDASKERLHVNDSKTQKELATGKNLEKVTVVITAFGKTRAK